MKIKIIKSEEFLSLTDSHDQATIDHILYLEEITQDEMDDLDYMQDRVETWLNQKMI